MFVSFFPRPKLFFISVIVWTALAMTLWYSFAAELYGSSEPGVVGVSLFWTARSLWFDIYFAVFVAIFAGFWMWFSPHPWAPWSILGSALILFSSYFTVQVTVALNSWRGPFYDMIQAALSKTRPVHAVGILRRRLDLRLYRHGGDRGPRADELLRQPLHLPLAHRDERISTSPTGRGCAPSKARRSACRKTPCGSRPSPNSLASIWSGPC